MSLEDSKAFDDAFDRAEARIAAESSSPQLDHVEEKAIADAVEDKDTPTEKPSRERDQSGKFTKGAKSRPAQPEEQISSDQEASAESTPQGQAQSEAAISPDAVPTVNPPAFWSAEHKALFAQMPPQVQQFVAEREHGLQQHISRQANELERHKTISSKLNADFGDDNQALQIHKAKLLQNGIRDEAEELHRYRAWDRVFESDPIAGIITLMQRNGITPEHLLGVADEYQVNPELEEVRSRAESAERQAQELRELIEQQQQQALISEIEGFKNGQDSRGQTRRAFVEAYEPQISHALSAIRAEYPHMSKSEALHHAYEFVMEQVTQLHGIRPQVAQPKAPAPEAVAKAKAVASSSTGAPSSGVAAPKPRLKGKDFNARLDSALDMAEEMSGLR